MNSTSSTPSRDIDGVTPDRDALAAAPAPLPIPPLTPSSAARYRIGALLGKGTYGQVHVAHDLHQSRANGEPVKVAIKSMRGLRDERDLAQLLREILMLRLLDSDHVLKLKDILLQDAESMPSTTVKLITPLFDTNLHYVINSPQPITTEHRQYFSVSILRGLRHLHEAGVVHRDMKPANVLVNSNCDLAIADFGLARYLPEDIFMAQRSLTYEVVTQWYRPPELMEAKRYGSKLDLWGFGCILAEMVQRRPLFKGENNAQQMMLIGRVLSGSRSGAESRCSADRAALATRLPSADLAELDLLTKLLRVEPSERFSASEALKHIFLKSTDLSRGRERKKREPTQLEGKMLFDVRCKASQAELAALIRQEIEAVWRANTPPSPDIG